MYAFDSSELPIITLYPFYVAILVQFMRKEKDLPPVKRFVLPSLSILGIVIVIIASIARHKMGNVYYLAVFAAVMGIGALLQRGEDGRTLFASVSEKCASLFKKRND